MTVYAWPTTTAFRHESCSASLQSNVRGFESPYTHSFKALDLLGEYLRMTVRLPFCSAADGAAREAFFGRLLGANLVSVYHLGRAAPWGTQRGTPRLRSAVAWGATTLPMIGGTSGATFEPGDMLGCGGELFMVADRATFDGAGDADVAVANRVRSASGFAANTAVTWDRPTTTWRLASPVSVGYVAYRVSQPLDIDLIQTFIS